MIDGHGDDLYRYSGRVKYNFSSNICAMDYAADLMAHLSACRSLPGSYPEPEPRSVELLIARELGVEPGNVAVTNGATEAIYLIAHARQGCRSAIVVPTFSEYADACRLYGHEVMETAGVGDIAGSADVVWLCNPCNPTGQVIPHAVLSAEINRYKAVTYVVDQAYADYTLKPVLGAAEAVAAGNVLLLGSFTKRFGVPGLRIGYVVGHKRLVNGMRRCRMPWSVSAFAVEAAKYLLSRHDAALPVDAYMLCAEAARVAGELGRIGIEVLPTDCNFMLCRLPAGRCAGDLKEWLVSRHGILIRDASNFAGLTPSHFRVAVQTPTVNDLLINAISQWMMS